jgi:hypothetical protein
MTVASDSADPMLSKDIKPANPSCTAALPGLLPKKKLLKGPRKPLVITIPPFNRLLFHPPKIQSLHR